MDSAAASANFIGSRRVDRGGKSLRVGVTARDLAGRAEPVHVRDKPGNDRSDGDRGQTVERGRGDNLDAKLGDRSDEAGGGVGAADRQEYRERKRPDLG